MKNVSSIQLSNSPNQHAPQGRSERTIRGLSRFQRVYNARRSQYRSDAAIDNDEDDLPRLHTIPSNTRRIEIDVRHCASCTSITTITRLRKYLEEAECKDDDVSTAASSCCTKDVSHLSRHMPQHLLASIYGPCTPHPNNVVSRCAACEMMSSFAG
mmetsp:Transcript_164/g.403  ORF Transcript_164/g.403 Transcript_164/m.403 type:complete len:156 (+) Transcript_164:475-942(+)